MTLPLALRIEARNDFDAAFNWYEAQRTGLGVAFAGRVQEVLDRISSMPQLYPRVAEDVRRANLRQFPYSIIYQIEADQVVVVAIVHGSRDPDLWRERL